ncbi:MAG: hypothetical protein H0T60_16155 [Acidobacteria bacterium]|nr:hypothetical protein [Acidobacteriota bacterium]
MMPIISPTQRLHQSHCGHINQAADKLFGWYIGNCKDKNSINKIAAQLGIGSQRLEAYIERQGPSSPYYHLLPRLREIKKSDGSNASKLSSGVAFRPPLMRGRAALTRLEVFG